MDEATEDARDATLDGNAAAGLLVELFGVEMTDARCDCANCGNRAPMGDLVAYTRAPGVVLRCRVCLQVVLRVAVTANATVVDARGMALVRIDRRPGPPAP